MHGRSLALNWLIRLLQILAVELLTKSKSLQIFAKLLDHFSQAKLLPFFDFPIQSALCSNFLHLKALMPMFDHVWPSCIWKPLKTTRSLFGLAELPPSTSEDKRGSSSTVRMSPRTKCTRSKARKTYQGCFRRCSINFALTCIIRFRINLASVLNGLPCMSSLISQ